MKKPETKELRSSFTAIGKMKVSQPELLKHLQTIPYLRPLKNKEVPTFSLVKPERSSQSELQVMGNKLIFSYRFERRSLKEYGKNLLQFLALLAYTSHVFETDLESVYPYIIETLSESLEIMPKGYARIENSGLILKRMKVLSEMNCSLSLKLIDTEAKSANLTSKNELLSRFATDIIANAHEKAGTAEPTNLHRILGTTAETYKEITVILKG
jgi:hypothetical protein